MSCLIFFTGFFHLHSLSGDDLLILLEQMCPKAGGHPAFGFVPPSVLLTVMSCVQKTPDFLLVIPTMGPTITQFFIFGWNSDLTGAATFRLHVNTHLWANKNNVPTALAANLTLKLYNNFIRSVYISCFIVAFSPQILASLGKTFEHSCRVKG